MNKKPEVYIASDYAGLKCPNGQEFYYGYEVTANDKEEKGDGEWCFQARIEGKPTVTIPFSRLDQRDQFEVVECLLAGIAIYISLPA